MKIKNPWIIILFLIVFISHTSWGKETTFTEDLIEGNKRLSKQFDDLASELDLLLSSRRQSDKKNRSSLSLIGFTESIEGQGVNQTGHIDIDLRLPNFEKEWKLKFSSFDQEDEFEGLSRNRVGARPQQQKYGTSLSFMKSFANIETTLRPRIELKDPLVSSFLLKLSHRYPLDIFVIKSRLKLFTHSVDGSGQSLSLDFEKEFNKFWLFRWFNEQQYLDKLNLMSVSQGPMVLRKLNDRMAVSHTISLNSLSRSPVENEIQGLYQTDKYHLSGYSLLFSFSHKIFRRVFHYQISPRLDFEKANNFKGRAGIILRTEIIF